jgi:hypothetical protein
VADLQFIGPGTKKHFIVWIKNTVILKDYKMIAILIILAGMLIYSYLYKDKADAIARKIRHSEYGFLYIIVAIVAIIIVILTQA